MAEYIDKDKLNKKKKYLFQTQGMPFPKSEYFIKVDDFMEVPTADVIERSKIDKAIEEIDFLRQHRAKYITEDNRICIDSGEVLEILKRNIGE